MSSATSRNASLRVRRVHLVTAPVAELRRGLGRLAERPVKRRRKLRRVTHDGRVGETVLVQFRADGAHAAVHHVARRDDVRAGLGVAGGGAREQLQRRVVQNPGARLCRACTMPQWPCSMYSHRQTSVMTSSYGNSFFSSRTVCWTMPFVA